MTVRSIAYREGLEVDLAQLAQLRRSVGWAELAPEVLAAQLAGSRWVISAWDGAHLVGFVRAISDGITNAYVCGLSVDTEYQRQGIGGELMRRLVAGRDGIRWILHTSSKDVAAFYAKREFMPAENMMRRDRRPRSS